MPFLMVLYVNNADDVRGMVGAINESDLTPDNLRIAGVYRWPTRDQLSCTGFCTNRNRMSPWKRNIRGYTECGTCGGRHVHTRRWFIGALLDYLGINLMPRSKTPKVFQNPQGWGK